MQLNDPEHVRSQYATEDNLRKRQAIYANAEGEDAREVLFETIAALAPRRLLEVGGGPGELAERIVRELRADVAYVDVSPRMVELAAARGVDAQVGDVQALPFADGTFDTAVAAWMLYHVPDLDRALAELARVLVRGGRLVAVTNAADHLRELREVVGGRYESTFTRENGEQWLARHFRTVERRDVDGWVTIDRREDVLAYRDSLASADAARDLVFETPLRTRRGSTVFVATT